MARYAALAVPDSDPFMEGSSIDKDDADPFLIDEGAYQHRKNLLPSSQLHQVLVFCDEHSLINAAQVNRSWREEATSDTVWKRLCKAKYGAEALRESKVSVKTMGFKLCFFLGVCKTVLVNTPAQEAIALVPYPGLTVKHMLDTLGVSQPALHTITSQSFSEAFETIMDDQNGNQGLNQRLLKARLCDILIDPFSTLYIEMIAARELPQAPPLDEAAAKAKWKSAASKAVASYPRFVQDWQGASQSFVQESGGKPRSSQDKHVRIAKPM